ncbi:hypothetical protein GWI33_020650 [Rhynchophorus ferrugineus]|uniref:Uncharacterized protein n=1 Tax=Rhynchophorus ferrugineus TaxID=354439 RepID=A0A834M5K0_RHYFE|nr:hypothetical protein GWI33_020650 [Rhynchophorus ferrugineus]
MALFGAAHVIQDNFRPTFKIQGQIYHLLGALRAFSNRMPSCKNVAHCQEINTIRIRSKVKQRSREDDDSSSKLKD